MTGGHLLGGSLRTTTPAQGFWSGHWSPCLASFISAPACFSTLHVHQVYLMKWNDDSAVPFAVRPTQEWRTPLKPYTFYYAKCNSQKVSFTRDGESVRRREWCRIYSFEFAHWISSHTLPARKLIGLPSVNRLLGPISLEILVSRTILWPGQKSRTNYRVSLQGRIY